VRCGAGMDRKAWKAKDTVVYFLTTVATGVLLRR
jgi:hypothetical protein